MNIENTARFVIGHKFEPADHEPVSNMRLAVESVKGQLGLEMRDMFDELLEMTPDAPGVTYTVGSVGDVPGWWCESAKKLPNAAILYLHGGAYVIGSAKAYRHLAGQLAAKANVSTFVPEYSLAPEHPFPAAVDDSLSAYFGLINDGFHAIAVCGDSAGGGLALATVGILAETTRESRPRCAVVMSPWTDLTLSGESMATRADADPLLTKESLQQAAKWYRAEQDTKNSQISPLFGKLTNLPPIQIHVGDQEILLDDSLRYGLKAAENGIECSVHVWNGMTHVFPSSVGTLVASELSLEIMGASIANNLL